MKAAVYASSVDRTWLSLAYLTCLTCLTCLWSGTAHAEQMRRIGDYEVHYIIVPTTFLKPAVADSYGLVRGRDRALVNVSVLDPAGEGVEAQVSGSSRNLLGQIQTLKFKQVSEQNAVYYLALLRHADEEHHRVTLEVTLPTGQMGVIEFQQKMYWRH